MISIICVYNDKHILNEHLLNSLENQENDYELILVDNTPKKFKSAAEALNFGAKNTTGKYLMFLHQDLELSSPEWLQEVEEVLESLKDMGVVGVAGTRDYCNISNMKHGHPPKLAGFQLDRPESVETVDECLAIIPRKLFNTFQFDDKVCQGWHLYVVDYCLTIKKEDYQVYVIPNYCYHQSEGSPFSEDYYVTLRKLIKKHANNYKWINTTTGNWHTSYPLFLQKFYDKAYRFLFKIRLKSNK